MIRAAQKTLRGALLLAASSTAAFALPSTPSEQAEAFAICAGRYEAIATHQKAFQLPNADQSAEIHDNFQLLLDATLPAALETGIPEQLPVQWHSGGWGEISTLLAAKVYSFDPQQAIRAQQRVEQHLQDCRGLIF